MATLFCLSYYASQKKTLEINPKHPLIKQMLSKVNVSPKTLAEVILTPEFEPNCKRVVLQEDAEDQTAEDLAMVLFETATLRSGYQLADTKAYGDRIERMLRLSMNVAVDEQVAGQQLTPVRSALGPS